MSYLIKQKGATLLEVVMVIILVGILSAGGGELVRLGFESYVAGQSSIDADWQGRTAFERMTRELHAVRSASDIIAATPDILTFTNIEGNTISYQLTGTQLMRNTQVLAVSVQDLAFHYYDSSGAVALNNSDIRYITVTLDIDNNTFTTGVGLWNLI